MELKIGMPVVLEDAKGLGDQRLWKGQEGMANSLMNVKGVDYVYFMPDNTTRMYAIQERRVKINEDKIEAWLEANS